MKHHYLIAAAATLCCVASGVMPVRGADTDRSDFETLPYKHRRHSAASGLHVLPGTRKASMPPAHMSTQGRPELTANSISSRPGYGMYSFFAEVNPTLSKVADTEPFFGGSVYVNGKYYGADYDYADYGTLSYVRWYVYDALTWHCEKVVDNPLDYSYIATDRTYDPTTATVYSVVYDSRATAIYLATTNLDNGASTLIAPLEKSVIMIAADATGQLYGIDTEANLYKVNKNDATLVLVGNTNIYEDYLSEYTQTITFDHSTGKLYWAEFHSEGLFTSVGALYEVNPVTAATVKIADLPNAPELTGLYVNEYMQPGVPAAVTALAATTASQGGLDYTFSCMAPTQTVDGATLSGTMTVTLTLDDELIATLQAAPGASLSHGPMTMTRGLHTLKAMVANDHGNGAAAARMFFAGWDVPAAPLSVRLTAADDNATLTWQAPQTGAEGGAVRGPMTYNITRLPDNEQVATGVSTTTWGEHISSPGCYSYCVTAVSPDGEGPSATSNTQVMGSYSVPYFCGYDSQADFDVHTVVDLTSHGKVWNYDAENGRLRHPWSLEYEIDDYICTPGIRMTADRAYQVSFEAYQMVASYNEHVMLYFGPSMDIEEMTLLLDTGKLTEEGQLFDATVAPPNDGVYYFAFRSKTGKNGFMSYVDNVSVTSGGSSAVPATISDFAARPADGGQLLVSLSLTTPSATLSGATLNSIDRVEITRDGSSQPIHTFISPAPGEALTCTDATVKSGSHTYRAVAYTGAGGSQPAVADTYVGVDVPQAPGSFDASGPEGARVLTWTAPEAGIRGGNLNGLLSYRLSRVVNSDVQLIADGLEDTSFTDTWTTDTQAFMYYTLTAVTTAGWSDEVTSRAFPVGSPYALPYAESFSEGVADTDPWSVEQISGTESEWRVEAQGEEPYAKAQDNDGGLVTFDGYHSWSAGCIIRLISPSIDISTYEDPSLTFYIYHYNGKAGWWQEDADPVGEMLQVEISVDGAPFTTIEGGTIPLYAETSGWKKYTLSLADYRVSPGVRIAFRGTGAGCFNIHLDNIAIAGTVPVVGVADEYTRQPHIAGLKGALRYGDLSSPLDVYDMTGRKVAHASDAAGIISLPAGVYTAVTAGQTTKTVVK